MKDLGSDLNLLSKCRGKSQIKIEGTGFITEESCKINLSSHLFVYQESVGKNQM